MLFGVDIASYQASPNFALLRDGGHDFAITKVTGEGSYVNPYWSANRDHARAAGLIVGMYDWVEPQGAQSGAEAAADYLRVVGERRAGELLCVDFETPDWASGPHERDIEGWMREYLYALRDQSGQPVIVYTAPYFLEETGAAGWDWLGRDFLYWEAAPGAGMLADDAPWPSGGAPWGEPIIHQHQWHARSAAIAGEFDRNRFRGDRAALMALGKPGTKAIPVKVDAGPVADGAIRAYVNDQGRAILEIDYGGTATSVEGVNIVDAGLAVRNAAGEVYDRSVLANIFQPWGKRA